MEKVKGYKRKDGTTVPGYKRNRALTNINKVPTGKVRAPISRVPTSRVKTLI